MAANNTVISDLQISYDTTFGQAKTGAVLVDNKQNVVVKNTDFSLTNRDPVTAGFYSVSAIMASNGGSVAIDGKVNIDGHGGRAIPVFSYQNATVNVNGKLNISLDNNVQWAFWTHSQATINFNSGSDTNIKSSNSNNASLLNSAGFINFRENSALSMSYDASKTSNEGFLYNEYGSDSPIAGYYKPGNGFLFEKDSLVSTYIDGKVDKKYQVAENYLFHKTDYLESLDTLPAIFLPDGQASLYDRDLGVKKKENITETQFNEILSQYDSLVKDGSYKGTNLLQSQNLKMVFNEDRSSTMEISGVDASTQGLGVKIAKWDSTSAVQNSLNEIEDAITQLRMYSEELGNYYSIVTNREEFTGNLINVLSEGADKLTLADMNEESANMLALQTRQQLAINSLSLASQANQSILKLF